MLLKLLDETDQTWALGSNMFHTWVVAAFVFTNPSVKTCYGWKIWHQEKTIHTNIIVIFHQERTLHAETIRSFIRRKQSMFRSCTLSSGKDNPCSNYILFIRKRQSMLRLNMLAVVRFPNTIWGVNWNRYVRLCVCLFVFVCSPVPFVRAFSRSCPIFCDQTCNGDAWLWARVWWGKKLAHCYYSNSW